MCYTTNPWFYKFMYNMDNIDNERLHNHSPHGNVSEHFKTTTSAKLDTDAEDTNDRHCVSLPLYYDQVNWNFILSKTHPISSYHIKPIASIFNWCTTFSFGKWFIDKIRICLSITIIMHWNNKFRVWYHKMRTGFIVVSICMENYLHFFYLFVSGTISIVMNVHRYRKKRKSCSCWVFLVFFRYHILFYFICSLNCSKWRTNHKMVGMM